MFTGIIQGKYLVKSIDEQPGLKTLHVEFAKDNIEGLKLGASVALNGTCLTVSKIDGQIISFDVMQETLDRTNIGLVKEGDRVNVERSASMGDEIGGHLMSGHIIGMAEVVNVETPDNNQIMTFQVDPEWMKYVFDKGFIGLDGASLTIVNPNKVENTLEVHMIPETLRLTMYADRKVGDKINVELDSRTQTIVDTVEQVLAEGDRL